MRTELGGLLKGLGARAGKRRAAPHFSRANALRDASQWNEAADAYAAGLEHQPRRVAVWVQLGNCLKEAGDFKRAEDAYKTALELGASHADAHLQLGHLMLVMGDRERAGEHYGRALALGCEDFHAIHFQADAAMRNKQWRQAAGIYDRLLKSHPERHELLVPLGHALKEDQAFSDAAAAWQRAGELNAAEPGLDKDVGHLYARMGQTSRAIEAFVKVLSQGSRDLDTGHLLAAQAGLEQGLRALLVRVRPDCDKSFLDGPAVPRPLNFTRLMLDFSRHVDERPMKPSFRPVGPTAQG